MTLVVAEPPAHEERVVAEDPDPGTIERTVRGLSWNELTLVVLRADDDNWIEGSGSLDPIDGLSARFKENGVERVSCAPPDSLEQILSLLQSYRAGDDRWREMIEWE